MKKRTQPGETGCCNLNRRTLFSDCGMGFTGLVLGAMLHQDRVARAAGSKGWAPPDGKPHFAPKAKSVIWLFMVGGVSHLESFDPKPSLNKYTGKSISETPYQDVLDGLKRLKGTYRLVALSNGEPRFLQHLVERRVEFEFDRIISVEEAGIFKPHPSVYRAAARLLGAEHHEILMVAAHSFDVMGARAVGFRGAYVNRYRLPFEDTTQYAPDMVVDDFRQLARQLLCA